jgi:hypothetical protein
VKRRPALLRNKTQGIASAGTSRKTKFTCLSSKSGFLALAEAEFLFDEDTFVVRLPCGQQVINDPR